MTNPGTDNAVTSTSSQSGVAVHADTRRNDREDHPSPEDQIRMRAYELYVERGMQPSDGLEDWLEAEREFHEQS
jgi:hypothetical protein